MTKLCWLDPRDDDISFPDVALALSEPDGLLAAGGRLSPHRLLNAYRLGIFPWYSAGQPILWWSPDPRAVLYPEALHISRSLAKTLRKGDYTVSFDQAFAEVIHQCAQPRADGLGSWLTEEMIEAYCQLHRLGHAHSIETWRRGILVGGLYGVAIGRVFFGESMFSRRRDASKVAFAQAVTQLRACGYRLIDCQVASKHLTHFGATLIPRREFIAQLNQWCDQETRSVPWRTAAADNSA